MTTLISVTPKLHIEALLEIENVDFKHWYELGVWWALYGDGQGNGPYDDCYLIGNFTSHIKSGWYNDFADGWFPMIGFELGMCHGGMIDPKTRQIRLYETIVQLTDPDFAKGYHVGRDYYFYEAPEEEKHPTDT